MPPITGSTDGPVAVTGASGYIGSHAVKNLVEAGYGVRASVRDASRKDKTEFLLAMNGMGAGSGEINSGVSSQPPFPNRAKQGCQRVPACDAGVRQRRTPAVPAVAV